MVRSGGTAPALALTFGAGLLLAGQGHVNGALTTRLGSALVAALVSFVVGLAALAVALAARPQTRRAVRTRPVEPIRWWYLVGGFAGALLVFVSALAVPLIGVALLTVCVVGGQTVGGLAVDRAGFGPGGRLALTAPRLGGAALAVGAVALAALGAGHGTVRPALFAAVAAAGLCSAGQQAVNGQLARVSGAAGVAALISFLVGMLALAVVTAALAGAGVLPSLHWPSTGWLYLGGLGGAAYIWIAAGTVSRLGVLRLTLSAVAGQLVGSVLLDATVPVHGASLQPATVAAAALTIIAVAVSGAARRRGHAPI